MQISKFHKALRYIRRPLCFLVVIAIVSIYILSDSAYAYVAAGDQSFITRFGIDTSTQNYAFYYRYGKARYDAEGHNSANLFSLYNNPIRTGWNGTLGSWWFDWFNAYTYASTVEIDGITYDLTNAYVIADSSDSWVDSNGRGIKWIVSEGYVCLANQYVVSESPFHFIYSDSGGTTRVVNVTSTENNGLYFLNLPSYAFGNQDYTIGFTSLDVFMSSSDGESGFTTITTESTDLDLSSDELFNFNNIKYDGLIINSGDPVPEPVNDTLSQFYTYCGIDAWFSDGNASRVLLNYIVSPNEYIRLHPELYDCYITVSAVIVTSGSDHPNIPLTYSKSYQQGLITYINSGSTPNLQVDFDDLVSAQSNNSLADALQGWWSDVTGSDSSYYNQNGSVISYGGSSSSGSRSFGGYSLNPNLKISDIVFQCSLRIENNDTDPHQVSGSYRFQQGLISNNRSILENTISQNFNPPENYNPQYPAEIKDSQGNVVVGGTSVNPVIYNNLNAIVEYLFNIDASDLNNIAGNTHNAIQTVISSMSDTSSNGFLGVLTETYSYIPDPIWNWIKTAVAVICGGAVIGWVFRVGRVRNGG